LRLVDAFQYMKQEEPGPAHQLVFVGEGVMLPRVKEQIHQQGLTPHARLLGFVPFEDLPALLNGADLCVFPSLFEGFGLPPLEAMSCGTPVIVSNTTSLPEVVGECGLQVNPLSVEAIGTAMHRLATDPALRAELRDKGLARARDFSWEKTARLTLAAYEEAFRRYKAAQTIPCPNFQTRYRDLMRTFAVKQADSYISEGSLIQSWPFYRGALCGRLPAGAPFSNEAGRSTLRIGGEPPSSHRPNDPPADTPAVLASLTTGLSWVHTFAS